MKSCQNCTFYKHRNIRDYTPYNPHLCLHEKARYVSQDIIYEKVYLHKCEHMRAETGECGPDAKLFKPTIFYLLKNLFK